METFQTPVLNGDNALKLGMFGINLRGGVTLAAAYGDDAPAEHVISCTGDEALHNAWSKDHFMLAPVDVPIAAPPDRLVAALLEAGAGRDGAHPAAAPPHRRRAAQAPATSSRCT